MNTEQTNNGIILNWKHNTIDNKIKAYASFGMIDLFIVKVWWKRGYLLLLKSNTTIFQKSHILPIVAFVEPVSFKSIEEAKISAEFTIMSIYTGMIYEYTGEFVMPNKQGGNDES